MKPILMNTEMVKAILEGRKCVTRRVVKQKQIEAVLNSPARKENPDIADERFISCLCDAPYEVGDTLWVRETWTTVPGGGYVYKASVECPDIWKGIWRPSIHMPRDAARLFLKVTDVRLERLQDITPEQIDDEGCKEWAYSSETGKPLPSGPSYFAIVWDRTIKPADRAVYGWEANPWVWVIEFMHSVDVSKSDTSGKGGG